MRIALAVAVALGVGSIVLADPSVAAIRKQTNIPAQDLGPALKEFAASRDLNVLYLSNTVRDLQTSGAAGEITTDEALTRILSGTGLTFRYLNDNTVTILPMSASGSSAISVSPSPASAPNTMSEEATPSKDQRSFWDRFRLAQAPQGNAAVNASQNSADTTPRPTQIEEIIVTAQKREERLRDVPIPVTALNSESLATNNQVRLQDYYSQVPGLNLTPSTQSGQILSVRGISTGSGNPTVGVTVDDVPLGSSTFLGGGAVVPDLDPADLARIEVLRGPQGTLYGASSISGVIKFVTADPSTEEFSGRLQGVASDVQHGDGMGYSVRGSVNVPVSDTVAVRASGFTRRDPGFVNNPTLGIEGVDQADAEGGRLSALWSPRENLSLKLGALYQEISGEGSSDVLPTLGELQQAYIRNSGGYDRKVQAYSAVFSADLDRVNVTSVSGYNINQFSDSFDGTFAFGVGTQAAFGVPGTPQFNENKTDKFSQEIRFSGGFNDSVDWLLGGFYTDEDSTYRQTRLATNPTTGAVAGTVSILSFPTTYEERAAFANLTFHLTEKFDVQLGGRQGWIDQSYSSLAIDRFGTATHVPEVAVDTEAFTYLATASYKISPQVMTYVRLASGYRAGGPNVTTGAGSAPLAYDPDDSRDYEIGAKGDLLNGVIAFDASVYYIDWKDIQLALRDPVTLQSYTDNAGAARSKGVELSIEVRPLDGLTLAAWGAYNDAELTEPLPATSTVRGSAGDRLPFGSKRSGNLSIKQEFPITTTVTGVIGGTAAYVGDRLGRFTATTRAVFPSYTRLDLTAGLKFDTWTATLFANNVADKRGMLATGLAPGTQVYIQPRTIGVSVSADF